MKSKQIMDSTVAPPFKRSGLLIHVVAWGLFFGIPFFFTGRESQTITAELYIRSMLVPLSFMFVFYINYLWLVRKFLFARRSGRYLLSNVLLIAFTMVVMHLVMSSFPHPDPHPDHVRELRDILAFQLINMFLYSLVAGLSVAIKMTDGWYKMEAIRWDLEKSRSEAELKNLKSQLNPHFLFNTLNNIYSLIAFSPEQAQAAVHDLSRLLRYVLYESSQPFVPLDKELDFVLNYVELMRIRLPEHVALKTDIEPSPSSTQIAPLLFISLVENAFKHGVSDSKPSFIYIDIHEEKGEVICSILNSDFQKDTERDKSGSGIGLANLRKRLALIYPEAHTFECGRESDCYRSFLSITIAKQTV